LKDSAAEGRSPSGTAKSAARQTTASKSTYSAACAEPPGANIQAASTACSKTTRAADAVRAS
jgi:hypothetical protein